MINFQASHGAGAVQGLYYLLTGIWPVLHIGSFLKVTGPKVDLWLVKAFGLVVAVIGAHLIMASFREEISFESFILAIGSAIVLALIDINYVFKRQISPIYLLDAAAQFGLVIWWFLR